MKANEALFDDNERHIGTRYTSLGHYFCQITILADNEPNPRNQADFNNLKSLFSQLSDEQVFEIARTLKFKVHYLKFDSDFHSNPDEEEVHLILTTNPNLKQWATIYPGLKFVKAYIVAHNRSKLTGPPLPERVFNKVVVKINIPEETVPQLLD